MNTIATPTPSSRFWLQSLSDGWAIYDNKFQKFEARSMDWDEAQEYLDELEARLYGDDEDAPYDEAARADDAHQFRKEQEWL